MNDELTPLLIASMTFAYVTGVAFPGVGKLHDVEVEAVVHGGFGFGVVLVGFAMQALE
jgi:hypothetical protein